MSQNFGYDIFFKLATYLEGTFSPNLVPGLHLCENRIFFLPVNILRMWYICFLGPTTLVFYIFIHNSNTVNAILQIKFITWLPSTNVWLG